MGSKKTSFNNEDKSLDPTLIEQLKDQRNKRSEALAKLKASVERSSLNCNEASENKDSKAELPVHINGYAKHPEELRRARKAGVAALKTTTNIAIENIKGTVFLDKESVKKIIDDIESSGSS